MKDAEKVLAVIDSCVTRDQLLVACNMADLWNTRHETDNTLNTTNYRIEIITKLLDRINEH